MTINKKESSEKITIVRKARKNNYSVIETSMLFDFNLSWEAKGVMAYLDAEGDIFRVPEDIIQELILAGYFSKGDE